MAFLKVDPNDELLIGNHWEYVHYTQDIKHIAHNPLSYKHFGFQERS